MSDRVGDEEMMAAGESAVVLQLPELMKALLGHTPTNCKFQPPSFPLERLEHSKPGLDGYGLD
jgi:hypothetical protein